MKIDCYTTNKQMLDVYLKNTIRIKELYAKNKLLKSDEELLDDNSRKIVKMLIENDQIEEVQAYRFYNDILNEIKRKDRAILTSYLGRIRITKLNEKNVIEKIKKRVNNSSIIEFLSDNDHIVIKDLIFD